MAVQGHDPSAGGRGPAERRRDVDRRWYWLLVVPLVGVLIPPVYNAQDPELAGLPFFYWYQLLWIPISVALTGTVYLKTRGRR